ncbi:MAG TPA: OB-fold domain-containing protein [Rubrobacter sp.]
MRRSHESPFDDEMNPESGEPPAAVYRRYLESGRLGFQRCGDCGSAVFYPRVVCPACGGADLAWETSFGRGVVYATTAVFRRDADPYNVALVDLEEDFRMMSRVERVPAEEVEVGTKVILRMDREGDDPAPVFVPEGEGR